MLGCVLWPRMWSILVNVPYELQRIVYSALIEWNHLQLSIRSIWLTALLTSTISLLIFCLLGLFISDRRVLKSPTIRTDLSVFLPALSFCLAYFDALLLGVYKLKIVMSSWRIDLYYFFIPLLLCNALLYLWCLSFALKSALSEINTATPAVFCLVLEWYVFFIPLLLIYIYLYI